MEPLPTLEDVLQRAPEEIAAVDDLDSLASVVDKLVGPKSPVGDIRRAMGSLDAEQRPLVGSKLNEVSSTVDRLQSEKRRLLEFEETNRRLQSEAIDVTLPVIGRSVGAIHLVQQTIEEISQIFGALGFHVANGPEADLGWYNFDALNTPATHPARLESDTMYLDYGDPRDEMLLRTQTSPVQARWMESHEPPIHIIVPGKCYRTDAVDASHLPVFHQVEGLAVDTDITFADLKGTLAHFAREFFGSETVVRFRPHFFPFTEPSAELDVSCFNCDGGEPGCRVCKGAGWLEMLGCGMVDPDVFRAVGYDPDEVTGWAFGMGVERMAMVRHDINDIRNFILNDTRFLSQFP
ncbi:MAG: phenylalanine--tRNA ligase subunit alpha [Acidimicrobiia bacterium]|nr:phenylalanine--tRNA ligase subunit alpha [Acidimicrobiia bacterium]